MGALLAKFRKEQSTEKKLELLEEKIQTLEKYTYYTQEQKKRFVGTFLAVSVGVYVIAAIAIFYFVYFPRTWKERCLYIVPLLIFPFLIIWLRRLFTWYFQRKLNKNADKLATLREEKKKILDQVTDNETYKVAVNLLARFGGGTSYNGNRLAASNQRLSATPYVASNQNTRALAGRPLNTQSPMPALNLQAKSTPTFRPAVANQLQQQQQQQQLQVSRTSQNLIATPLQRADQQLRRRTPFPIVNHAEKSFLERCLDVIIGDGPQDRFAIICRECHSHNGMALKEEFDYVAYRCAFCNAMNPARKTRPVAPRLSLPAPVNDSSPRLRSRGSDSSISTPSSDASDGESSEGSNKRRVQLRLTESTANQSESPEINNHETHSASAASLLEEKPVNEPTAENHTEELEPMEVGDDDDDAPLLSKSESSSNIDAHKKAD